MTLRSMIEETLREADERARQRALAKSRAVRDALASGRPPEGWPRASREGYAPGLVPGDPVPKCIALYCSEPAAYWHSVQSLAGYSGTGGFVCEEHLTHFLEAAGRWVRPRGG